ncbi:RWD2B-like protein, partial [Mya arenaria]
LDDQTAIGSIQTFLNGKLKYEYLHSRLGFTVHISPGNCKTTIELVCQLPHEYPAVPPVVFTRAPNMNRNSHSQLNEALHEYIIGLDRGELCLYSVIEWLQENLEKFETDESHEKEGDVLSKLEKMKLEEDSVFTRLWIYSHHIYSKFKRRDIIDWASELKLTGFSLPGKPGVVCVEGYSRSVDDYWHRLRRLNWKKLVVKEKEGQDIGDGNIEKYRKFEGFEEKVFDVRGGKGREYHMDLGKLYEFLDLHDCGHIFQMYFGVEGKSNS